LEESIASNFRVEYSKQEISKRQAARRWASIEMCVVTTQKILLLAVLYVVVISRLGGGPSNSERLQAVTV
jgi:hypothetical protein